VNDSLGHRVGDRLLCTVAKILEGVFSSFKPSHPAGREAPVAFSRIGGNGFGALLADLHNITKVDDATAVARRVQNALSEPIQVDGHKLRVSASIGISVSPGDGQDADTLLKNAEVAMYQAKQRGRKTYTFFSNEMNAHASERMTLEGQMRKAVDEGEFVLFYQPKVDIASRRITGAEALLRWRHPELGILSPDKFIPIAEENGLIVEIGQWVLRTACAQVAAWHQQGLPRMSVSVNVSVPQFKSGTIWHAVRGAVERSRIPPQLLALELTESMLMDDGEETLATLHEIKDMGVRLSVDDFGTGYSSLTYLSRFPIDELKIDRTFVRGLPGERQNAAIVGAILVLGRELGMNVVAEGVETKEQRVPRLSVQPSGSRRAIRATRAQEHAAGCLMPLRGYETKEDTGDTVEKRMLEKNRALRIRDQRGIPGRSVSSVSTVSSVVRLLSADGRWKARSLHSDA
jgi:diguanylate cyclase (GGDEF)-like protein